MRPIIYMLIFAGSFATGYYCGHRPADTATIETVRIDTVFYECPMPVRLPPPTFATIAIPRILFAPTDTIRQTAAVAVTEDSVELQVVVERKLFGDSTYRAQVSGPRIGELGPSLDWIETYSRNTHVQSVVSAQSGSRRNRFAVTAGIGAAYTPQGFQPYIGVGVGMILWKW